MTEPEPVARIDAEALKELEKHPEAAATVWSGKARNQFAKGAVPLVRLSSAQSAIAEREREAVHLKAEISSSDMLIAALTARAEAAEALLKDAFLRGFMSSAEGYNGEYPFGLDDDCLSDPKWIEMRARVLGALKEKP